MTPPLPPRRRRTGDSGLFRKEQTIYLGDIHAAREPTVIKTLLGSCIAVCLYDPAAFVGGMNHFMLPRSPSGGIHADATRFGVHAMDCLISALLKAGGDRRRFVAKPFGGAHVLNIRESGDSVPQQNIDFIHDYLECEGFAVVNEDLGGYLPREVHFQTWTGRAFVRQVKSMRTLGRLIKREENRQVQPPRYGDVTFFGPG